MSSSNKYSLEVRERAVRMVLEHQSAHDSQWAAIGSIAVKIGCTSETLRKWVRQAERDQGRRPGLTSAERERLKALERENPREVLVDESVEGGLLREVTLVRACVTVESKSRAGGHWSCAVMLDRISPSTKATASTSCCRGTAGSESPSPTSTGTARAGSPHA